MFVGLGPDAEFLHVVAHGSHTTGMRDSGLAEPGDGFYNAAERQQVAKFFLAGKERDSLAAIFGEVCGEEFVRLEACRMKMNVVEQSVAHAGGMEDGWELRLPNALGEPRSGRA